MTRDHHNLLGKFLASFVHILLAQSFKSCLEGSQAVPNVVCTHRVRGTAVDPGLKEGEGPLSLSLFMRISATGQRGERAGIKPLAILDAAASEERNLIKFRRDNIDADSDWEGTWGEGEIYKGA